jgi:dephospho-CoA kinase
MAAGEESVICRDANRKGGPWTDRRGRERGVPVIGILGGIASGKSLAARALAGAGAEVIDVDALGHALLARPGIREALVGRFGSEILDEAGGVDRRRLGAMAFGDADGLAFLNGLMHGPMREEIARRVAEAEQRGVAAVIDAALLLERDLGGRWCTHLVFVDAPADVRRTRAARSRGWSAEELARREAAQMAPERKRREADVVIENAGDAGEFEKAVVRWFKTVAPGESGGPDSKQQ